MPEPLLLLAILVPVFVIGYRVLKWTARIEGRAQVQQTMDRVYYSRRGRKTDVPEFRRRPEPERKGSSP